MLVTTIFSFSHNLFKSCLIQGKKKLGLCGTELSNITYVCFIQFGQAQNDADDNSAMTIP